TARSGSARSPRWPPAPCSDGRTPRHRSAGRGHSTDGRTPGAGVLRALRRPSPAVRAKPDSGRRPAKPGPAGAPGRPAPGPAPLQELEVLSGRRDEAGTGERVVRV